MNLMIAVAIVLLNLYVAVGTSYWILQFVWSTHSPLVIIHKSFTFTFSASFSNAFTFRFSSLRIF